MLQHLLYVVAKQRLDDAIASLNRLGALPHETDQSEGLSFRLSHKVIGDLQLQITMITSLDQVVSHFRQYPVDLLVYDERFGGVDALKAIKRICSDLQRVFDQWGPDFYFPTSRIVVILEENGSRDYAFELGRLNIRDVLVAPKSTARLLKWLWEVLYGGIIRENRVGVALSGGGIDGLLYQIGVLHALNEALSDRDLFEVDLVSGISSGALAGTVLACRIEIAEIIRSFHGKSKKLPNLKAQTLFDLAAFDIAKRMFKESFGWKVNPSQWVPTIARMIPTGMFKGEKIEEYLQEMLQAADQPDRFDKLGLKLFIGATDQDSFEHVIFGEKGRNKMPISEACRASCAFPLFFTPKTILGRHYIDGQVTRSCNVDTIIQEGASLLFVIDPLKPATNIRVGSLEEEGGYYGAIQVIKALCSTRFEANIRHVASQYPDVDFIVFQPDDECAALMTGSPMSYKIKTKLMKLAYLGTLRKLRKRYDVYQTKMARYGFHLCSKEKLQELEDQYDHVFKNAD